MRALWWTGSFWPAIGGMEVFTARLLEGLVRRGHEIAVVADGNDASPEHASLCGVPIHRFPFYATLRSGDAAQVAALQASARELLRAFEPDVVHLHSLAPASLFALQSLETHPTKVVLTKHDAFTLEQRVGPDTLVGRILTRVDAVTCPSHAVRDDVCRAMPSLASRAHVIRYGVAVPCEPPTPVSFDPPRLVCIARLVHQKGIDLVVGAMARLRARVPDVELSIAGEGPERDSLERLAERLGVAGGVRFLGWVAPGAVSALMRDASVVVIPSRFTEGFGLVAVEAGYGERPVVAADVPGLDEAVAHGQTGLLFPAGDAHALADSVLELLADVGEATRLGRRGRQRALEMCDLDTCVARYHEVYSQLVSEVLDD